ncbi:MAG TPA: XrtA/PEP-CTERM system exopolysaccharide export protein [Acetobacteraceae bacterium]|nr:XrtA/PEP-CTERM system exopolysaccharide export protein [Acetobacteraceae bacterium]
MLSSLPPLPVLLVACGCGLASCAAPRLDAAGPATASPISAQSHPNEEYVIGSGDVISVFIYHAPELSEPEVPVRPDGRISVPLVQDITASGKTANQLSREIESRLKKYVRDPNVTVIVRSFVGPLERQIKVIGEATEPEAIPYRDRMTLLDVMIATKGLTKFAAGNRAIVVRRTAPAEEKVIHVRLADLIKDGDISQNIAMQPGDTLIIPQTWF